MIASKYISIDRFSRLARSVGLNEIQIAINMITREFEFEFAILMCLHIDILISNACQLLWSN